MRRTITLAILSALVLGALVLGYLIYINYSKNNSNSPQKTTNKNTVSASVATNSADQSTVNSLSQTYLSSLSKDEQKIAALNLADPNVIKNESRSIETAAKESNTLNISNCEPKPIVLKIKLNSTFKVINDDSEDRPFNAADIKITVPAHGSKDVTASFKNGAGLYSYGCSSGPNASRGILFVTQ